MASHSPWHARAFERSHAQSRGALGGTTAAAAAAAAAAATAAAAAAAAAAVAAAAQREIERRTINIAQQGTHDGPVFGGQPCTC
jgi:hypothetical protein